MQLYMIAILNKKFVSSLNGFRNIICCKNKIRGYSYNNFLKIVVSIDTAILLLKQELITLPEHLKFILVLIGACVTQSLAFCVVFVDHCMYVCTSLLLIVLSLLLRLRLPVTSMASSNFS
jgi:hypothetical protein